MSKMLDLIDSDAAQVTAAVDLSALEGNTVVLTGASGLLGLNLLAAFRHWTKTTGNPIDVVAVTRQAPPPGLEALFAGPHVRQVQADLTDQAAVRQLPAAKFVIHAASYAQPAKFMESPFKTIQLNTSATGTMLESLPEDGKFLFVSSSEVYSGSPHLPHTERDIGTTDPSHPRACYIEGKRCGEAVCNGFRARGLAVKSARLALAYGPGTRADDQRVMNSIIRRAFQERRVTLMDQGAAVRTYCYVTDVVEMLLAILLNGREPVYNVGGTSRVTVLEMAQAVGRNIGVPVETPPAKANEMSGAPADVALDLSRVGVEFGKTDFVSFDDGLDRIIQWQRHLYGVSA